MRTILIGLYIACELIANVTASKPAQLDWIVVPAAISIDIVSFAPPYRVIGGTGHLPARQTGIGQI
jgi:hypothetical protein